MPRERNQARRETHFLLSLNATGKYRLKLVVVGKSKKPRAFVVLNIELDLLVVYYHSKKVWFNFAIFSNWFSNDFMPAVRIYQEEALKISPDKVRAILILDNAPAHPSKDTLSSKDEKIKVLFIPPNTTRFCSQWIKELLALLRGIIFAVTWMRFWWSSKMGWLTTVENALWPT